METTQVKSTVKTRKAAVLAHVLDCIDFDAVTAYDAANNDLVTRLALVKSEFEHAANHPYNLRMFPNKQARFIDWLRGLPSVFSHEFTRYGKGEKLSEFGYVAPKNSDSADYKYMNLIHGCFIKLCGENGIDF